MSKYPVIDAEAIATEIWHSDKPDVPEIAKIITDNIDLKLDWRDGKAEWGDWRLQVRYTPETEEFYYQWDGSVIFYDKDEDYKNTVKQIIPVDTQELAQAACESALKKIICGVKE